MAYAFRADHLASEDHAAACEPSPALIFRQDAHLVRVGAGGRVVGRVGVRVGVGVGLGVLVRVRARASLFAAARRRTCASRRCATTTAYTYY